jgi:hypothetical protein
MFEKILVVPKTYALMYRGARVDPNSAPATLVKVQRRETVGVKMFDKETLDHKRLSLRRQHIIQHLRLLHHASHHHRHLRVMVHDELMEIVMAAGIREVEDNKFSQLFIGYQRI